MNMTLIPTVSIFVFLALCAFTEAKRGPNPCHPDRSPKSVGSSCQGVIINPKLCLKCKIRAIAPDGYFPDCTDIYAITPSCQTELQKYVDLNPCDNNRMQQLAKIGIPKNRKLLDFFLYALCEECCDCIPFGARPGQYNVRKKKGQPLTQIDRPNCLAHVHFDVCKIWPNVRDIAGPGGKLQLKRKKICPDFKKWIQSPQGKKWKQLKKATFNNQMARFMRRLNTFPRCRNKSFWKQCTKLELLQKRI